LPVTLQPIGFARITEHQPPKAKTHPPEQGKAETPNEKIFIIAGGTLNCLLMYSFSEFLLIDRGWQKFFIIFFRIFGKIYIMAQEPVKYTDSAAIYSKRMLSNMDMADRSKGEMKEVFTKKWKQDAIDLDRYTKIKAMKKPLKNK